MSNDQLIDQYAGFDHKTGATGQSLGLPTWVTDDLDLRRLRSYAIAAAYHESVARWTLGDRSSKKKEWREHGEPSAIAARFAASVVGDDLTIRVKDADEDLPDSPPISPEPDDPGDTNRVLRRAFEVERRVWEQRSGATLDVWEAAHDLQPRLKARQAWLRSWAETVGWEALIREEQTEMVVPLGDGVSVLSVSAGGQPTKELWDPDSYFPVLPDGAGAPTKIHLAYEFEDEDKRWIRRVTYELVDIQDIYEVATQQTLPYSDTPTTVTCLMTDAVFELDGKQRRDRDGLGRPSYYNDAWDIDSNEWVEANELDLRIDFIPVVHKPRTWSSRTHFGRPLLVRVAQLLDGIADADTDTSRASALNGQPPMVASGLQTKDGKLNLGPGSVVPGPVGASLSPLEMSDNLRSASEHAELLRDRLSGVVSIPKGLLGRPVDTMNAASGVAWQMSFTPFIQEIGAARLVLDPRIKAELEMVQKLAIVAQDPSLEGDNEVYPAFVEFGSFMPSDLAGLVKLIVDLAAQGMMEPRLCFKLLESAGMEVGDIEQVVDAIKARDTVRALDLIEIAGTDYAAQWLGVPPAEEVEGVDDTNPPAPVITLP